METPIAHQPVFANSKVATNMPFFDGATLLFCQSASPLKKTQQCEGTIWKTIRRNPTLAKRFEKYPRSQEIHYRAWKLAYCNWQDKTVQSIATGLPENFAERAPSMYREGNRIHVSFVSGLPSVGGPSYRLYNCSGPDLAHLEPAKPLQQQPVFFGFVSQHHICWGIKKTFQLTEKASGKTLLFETSFARIACVTFLAEDPAKLLITGLDNERQHHTVLYDLSTGKTSDVLADGPVYKSSLHGNQLIYTQKLNQGYENRELCVGTYTTLSSSIQILKAK